MTEGFWECSCLRRPAVSLATLYRRRLHVRLSVEEALFRCRFAVEHPFRTMMDFACSVRSATVKDSFASGLVRWLHLVLQSIVVST